MTRQKRDESAYVNDNLARGLKVLQALKGTKYEPVSIQRVADRTGLSYDFCRNALITLKREGFAAQVGKEWTIGVRLMQFAANYNEVVVAYASRPDSVISESEAAL